MMKPKVLPLVLLLVFAGIFWAFKSLGEDGKTVSKQQKILTTLGSIIEENHYDPKPINDDFSREIFKKFLGEIDAEKNILLQSDLNSLKKYETYIDDEIHGATMEFLPTLNPIFTKRQQEIASLYKTLLANPFDFTIDEKLVADGDKLNFPATDAERKDRWRKKLKYLTLERYNDLMEQREKNKGTKDFVVKTDKEIEAEARQKVMKIMDKSFDRMKYKLTDEDRFNTLINSITTFMDPHSDYFPPVEKRSFDEQMSGRFYGIGASLKEEEGGIKVATLLTGSPAWKSGEVQVGDIIMRVGQGKQEPVDLTGYAVEDAVKIIRGTKGTEVRLTLKKGDGSLKVVSLIRDEIVQDEGFARSAIIKDKNKIGYIYLPEFYADFERQNGSRSAVDVAKEVQKLKEANVDGIIIDLRNNGGGSLMDVVNMVGLFIPDGPIVQVKDREGKPTVLGDNDKSVLYSGPLAVMVNEFSASASEIFAAAIQDYGRGVILGSSSTYGKGTVQRNIPFGKPLDFASGLTEYGAIKLTLQKFYRVNGGSTQLRGVTPDIIIPDQYESLKFREKDNPNALKWDEIQKSNFKPWQATYNLATVKAASQQRIANSIPFTTIKKNAEWLAVQNDKEYNLNYQKFAQEQKSIRAAVKQNDTLSKSKTELPIEGLTADTLKYNNVDKEKGERYRAWLKNLRTDIYINETANVVNDMIGTKAVVIARKP
ncbi:tail-specific protease [Segetibacter sp. 3557_3]|uniref:carboxy terminal-processing peptidase n=1 Tax=Segetibacter sp. 3557_3 TaxID=2547429 RepID=UPI001058FE79|nr:carboxy terminal-processing peptidase [Segetibacter sp. 3557_3]TDH27371.1 tail-specific protease [Segetibacter sp. 3557_3]